jgi:hypothetical protein
MRRIPAALAHSLLAIGSLALLQGTTCVAVYCSEDCNPCLTQCQCHTCPHAVMMGFDASHRLVSFELVRHPAAEGCVQETFAWIGGLAVINATGRSEITGKDLREFAEGVLGVNRELLDLPAGMGPWTFASVDLAQEYALVSFVRAGAQGQLEFVFDTHGKLLEIDRTLPGS